METINIIIVLQGLFWALLILSSRLKSIEKYSLSVIMIMCALIQLTNFIPSEGFVFLFQDTLNISFSLIILSSISLYTIQSIRFDNNKNPLKNPIFLTPLITSIIALIVFMINELSIYSIFHQLIYPAVIFCILIITVFKLVKFVKKKHFSSHFLENTGLMISSLLLSFGGIMVSIIIVMVILARTLNLNFPGGNDLWINSTIAFGMFVIGYLSITKQFKEPSTKIKRNQNKAISPDNSNKQKLIEDAFKLDKIHLDNELTIDKLAFHLSLDTTELSSILNHEMNTNFYQLINSYRVEEVKKKLQEDDQRFFTLLAIAFDCGFNSKSTFNRVFKEFTGKSPKEFKDNVKK